MNYEQLELNVMTTNTVALNLYHAFCLQITRNIKRDFKLLDATYHDFYIIIKFI